MARPSPVPYASTHTHTHTHWYTQHADCSMFAAAPHTHYLHQFCRPQDAAARRRPHASRRRCLAAGEQKQICQRREKGSSDEARPIFHENEVLWHSLQGGGGHRMNGCEALIMWTFLYLRHILQGGRGGGVPWGHGAGLELQHEIKTLKRTGARHGDKLSLLPRAVEGCGFSYR